MRHLRNADDVCRQSPIDTARTTTRLCRGVGVLMDIQISRAWRVPRGCSSAGGSTKERAAPAAGARTRMAGMSRVRHLKTTRMRRSRAINCPLSTLGQPSKRGIGSCASRCWWKALGRSSLFFVNGRCARFPAIGHILRATSQDRYKLSRCCARAARQLKASPHFFGGSFFFPRLGLAYGSNRLYLFIIPRQPLHYTC